MSFQISNIWKSCVALCYLLDGLIFDNFAAGSEGCF